MTMPRFLTLAGSLLIASILVTLLATRGAEAMNLKMLKGASLWIAVAGLFTVFGGVLAIVGALRNNAEQTEMILGSDDTFCQLTVYINRPDPGWYVSTLHYG